jgi:TonB-linked SusC/RagA family outer membrane protein
MGIRCVFALALLGPAALLAQQGIITGKVTDAHTGEPRVTAVVTVEGTELAAVTGRDGAYRLTRVSPGAHTISARGIGYAMKSQVVTVPPDGGTVTLDFGLEQSATHLNEVVVTGTAGDQTRVAQGAVVASINAEDLVSKAPVNTITEALEGRVAGVNVTDASGTVGASPRIQIRGPASIDLSNYPIVFVDGVRFDNNQRNDVGNYHGLEGLGGQSVTALNDINPDDIESIEIVKGPAAATLYGADASAGVIQIITKKGRLGSHGFAQTLTGEWDQVQPNFTPYSVYGTCGVSPGSTGSPICAGKPNGAVVSDNPLVRNNVFKNGQLGQLSYTGQGGGDNFGYFISASANNEAGTEPNNFYQRRTGRGNFHWVITPQLSIDATLSLSRNDYRVPQGDDSQYGYLTDGEFESSPFAVAIGANGQRSGGLAFPIAALEAIQDEITTTRLTPTTQVQYAPFSWFTNRFTLGGDFASTNATTFFPQNSQGWYTGDQANGYVEATQNPVNTYTVDYLGNIKATFGRNDWITSNLSFGTQYIDIVDNFLTGVGLGIASNNSNLVSSAASSESHQGFAETRSLGILAQEELDFSQTLFLQAGFRVDQNSSFGQSYGAFFLPKVSASYLISQMPFWHGITPIVSTFRLRGAYGETGRSPTPGASLATYLPAPYVTPTGGTGPGVVPASPGNPNLKPERGREYEAGFDAGFLQDRFGVEFTYFDKRSDNLLLLQPIAPSLAYTINPFVNAGTVTNSGLEFTVRATPVTNKNVTWDATFSGNTLRNNLVSLGGNTIAPQSLVSPDLTLRYAAGNPLLSYYSSKILSVNTAGGYATVTNQPVYDGPQFPTFQANVGSTVTLFQVVRLYGLLSTQRGGKIANVTQLIQDLIGVSKQVNLAGKPGGYTPTQMIERFGPFKTQSGQTVAAPVLDAYVQRTDFTRFSELSAALILPPRLARMMHGSTASLTFGVKNLALWKASDYQGWDPEVLSATANTFGSASSSQLASFEEFTVPPPRRFFVRLNLGF